MLIFKALVTNSAINAVHDSAERVDAPKCMPETRVAVQEEILSWITHGDTDANPKRLLWVTGPAGTGKTAILGSIADECQGRSLLAASFFFSSFSTSLERRSKRCLIATLAFQLTQHVALEGVGDRILNSVERNPAIFKKQLKEQLEVLILGPLREFAEAAGNDARAAWPRVIVVDGLDECNAEIFNDQSRPDAPCRSKEDEQTEILTILTQAANDPAFPFRIVLASRPERHIREFMSRIKDDVLEVFLDEKYLPDADITLFLRAKFADIRRRYKLPELWPGDQVIGILVNNASGQFIYAATVMRFMEGPSGPPHAQLECVLRAKPVGDGTNPFAALDALYRCILESCPSPKLSCKWLRTLPHQSGENSDRNAFIRYYWSMDNSNTVTIKFVPPPAVFVNQLLESTPGEVEYALGSLSSLLCSPGMQPGEPTFGKSYTFYHRSFLDFLAEPSRSSDLHVPTSDVDDFLRQRMFKILKGVCINELARVELEGTSQSPDIFYPISRQGSSGHLRHEQ